jgi:outer membrane receptor for monomeric catechols
MPAGLLRTIAVLAVCLCNGAVAVAVAAERPHHKAGGRQHAPRTWAADRDPYADPAAPYKADRLQSPRGQRIIDIPGQTTVLTREVLDDMNARSLRDALRSTAGVTVGR